MWGIFGWVCPVSPKDQRKLSAPRVRYFWRLQSPETSATEELPVIRNLAPCAWLSIDST